MRLILLGLLVAYTPIVLYIAYEAWRAPSNPTGPRKSS